jgi:hypothetical protein
MKALLRDAGRMPVDERLHVLQFIDEVLLTPPTHGPPQPLSLLLHAHAIAVHMSVAHLTSPCSQVHERPTRVLPVSSDCTSVAGMIAEAREYRARCVAELDRAESEFRADVESLESHFNREGTMSKGQREHCIGFIMQARSIPLTRTRR